MNRNFVLLFGFAMLLIIPTTAIAGGVVCRAQKHLTEINKAYLLGARGAIVIAGKQLIETLSDHLRSNQDDPNGLVKMMMTTTKDLVELLQRERKELGKNRASCDSIYRNIVILNKVFEEMSFGNERLRCEEPQQKRQSEIPEEKQREKQTQPARPPSH